MTQVGIDRRCETYQTPEEVATSRFLSEDKKNFEIEEMRGAPHFDPYEAFKECYFLELTVIT
jgi:hypothetical protein